MLPVRCLIDQFTCRNGQCVALATLCQGLTYVSSYCLDGSDLAYCNSRPCPGQFNCGGSTPICIGLYLVCDGKSDCPHGEDEQNCTNWVCQDQQYKCNSGQCISNSLVCDGVKNCADGSDEEYCPSTACPAGFFKCVQSQECIPNQEVCDGNRNCPNGEDEMNCGSWNCSTGYFKCASGQCVLESLLCDGVANCPDESDEQNCKCCFLNFISHSIIKTGPWCRTIKRKGAHINCYSL